MELIRLTRGLAMSAFAWLLIVLYVLAWLAFVSYCVVFRKGPN